MGKKLEIYQVGKVSSLTVVECDKWELDYNYGGKLKCYKKDGYGDLHLIAVFFVNNIAGFKEV